MPCEYSQVLPGWNRSGQSPNAVAIEARSWPASQLRSPSTRSPLPSP
ncbi:unannotated protein [freshwater metagenome]|uniref:Unannotated protein n=1 Tax=freshwater metagenome TaxID=449393 RepID=A0A6J6EZY5_9ZZZZ